MKKKRLCGNSKTKLEPPFRSVRTRSAVGFQNSGGSMGEPKVRQKWINGELVDVINGVPVEQFASEQEQFLENMRQAFAGETPVDGEDSSWVCIGGIGF